MDILRIVDLINLRLITLLFAAAVPDIGDTSIFEIVLGEQAAACSSLTNQKPELILDPKIIHPVDIRERKNYEYTITTPNFPFTYPKNIHCTTLIKAPSYDYHIVLEMRQLFDVEPSKNCMRDFLEITDGPYGFSKKIGRFCNSELPPKEVISSGPFLWLRFRSDETLPHNGFAIAYRFIRNTKFEPKIHYCYKKMLIPPGEAFNLNTTFLKEELKNFAAFQNNDSSPIECIFDFHVSQGYKTFLYQATFKKPNLPIPCSMNGLDIFNRGTFENDIYVPGKRNYFKICEEKDFKQHLFKGSTRSTFRVTVKDINKMNTISIIITSVKILKDKCSSDYFLCSASSKLCISNKLLCNDETNCPESTDENCIGNRLLKPGEERNVTTTPDSIVEKKAKAKMEEDKIIEKTNRTHAIILGSIGSILMISMVFCLALTIHSKKKDKETRCINVVDMPVTSQDKSHTKNLFYELLQSSEPSVAALSTEKLNRKMYNDNQIWSKRPLNDASIACAHRNNDSNYKLNGGIKSDFTMRSTVINQCKTKTESSKGSSLNRIGKYLSVPNPAKNDNNHKQKIPSRTSINQIQSFNITSPSDDIQSWSSHSFSKQNLSINRSSHHIQRASSMGSGLRRQLLEPVDNDQLSKNIEWYCGPVIRGSDNRNNSSETLNAYSAKSSQHVPGCRSLPNFSNAGLQNPVYYTKPIPSKACYTVTDSLDCSADDNSSYRADTPSFSFQNHYQTNNSHKFTEPHRHNGGATSQYGFKYFCAHEPMSSNDFVEYIA